MAKVVVIGGGYGGITVAGGLDDVADVTLVEQKDQFVHHAAALRAAVDSVWGHTVFMPYSRLLERGQVVHGTCMRVDGRTVYVHDARKGYILNKVLHQDLVLTLAAGDAVKNTNDLSIYTREGWLDVREAGAWVDAPELPWGSSPVQL